MHRWVSVFLILAACKKERVDVIPPTPVPTETAVDLGLDGGMSIAPKVKAPRPDEDAGSKVFTVEEKKVFEGYSAAMGAGRKATKEKRWSDADDAFAQALKTKPNDAQAHSERGYALLLDDKLDEAEKELQSALDVGVKAQLASQVYFNLGLLREKKKEDESSRQAFAIANALVPSAAAKAKLAGRSACTVDVQQMKGKPLPAYADFDDLAKEISPVQNLGSTKKSVCIRTHMANGDPSDTDVCSGPPPWVLTHNHVMFSEELYFVVPKKGGAGLFAFSQRIGNWPARCMSLPSHEASLLGDILHITSQFEGKEATHEGQVDKDGMLKCLDVLGYEEHLFFDTKTGKLALSIFMPSGIPHPTITQAPTSVTLAGAGCDRTIELPH